MRNITSVLAFIAAVALMVLLFLWSGISISDLAARVGSSPYWLPVSYTVLMIVQLFISSVKWRMILERVVSDKSSRPGLDFYMTSSAASAVFSQFLPAYVCSIAVRSFAAKRLHGISVTTAATTSAFEQFFDLMILLLMAMATALVWVAGWGANAWILATLAIMTLGLGLTVLLPRFLGLLRIISGIHPRLKAIGIMMDSNSAAQVLNGRLFATLYLLSLARYLTMAVRPFLLVVALKFDMVWFQAIQCFILVQTTLIASLTPGNIGLQEWGWTGVLSFVGMAPDVAAEFALMLRIFGIVSILATVAIVIPARSFVRKLEAKKP